MSGKSHIRLALLRFADRDAMGHVNSLRLAELIEDARLDFLAAMPQPAGLEWRLVALNVNFLAQPTPDGAIETRSTITRIGSSSFEMSHEVVQGEMSVVTAVSVLVQADPQAGRGVAMDGAQRDFLA